MQSFFFFFSLPLLLSRSLKECVAEILGPVLGTRAGRRLCGVWNLLLNALFCTMYVLILDLSYYAGLSFPVVLLRTRQTWPVREDSRNQTRPGYAKTSIVRSLIDPWKAAVLHHSAWMPSCPLGANRLPAGGHGVQGQETQ
jgi:hypothetical protein